MAQQSAPSRDDQPLQTLTITFHGTPQELTNLAHFLGSHNASHFQNIGARLQCTAQSSLEYSKEHVRCEVASPHPDFSG